jgi:UDP-N-acetylmuramate--alanine ligase
MSADQILVTSGGGRGKSADVQRARSLGAEHLTRPQLLARLFNAAPTAIASAAPAGNRPSRG